MLLSNFALNCNLRHYTKAPLATVYNDSSVLENSHVGPDCLLIVYPPTVTCTQQQRAVRTPT